MKDINNLAKVVFTGLITIVVVFAFAALSNMEANNGDSQAEYYKTIIENALVQCYALEGSYPSAGQFEGKMEEYGVILNTDRYIYHYETFSSNLKPVIKVFKK